LKACALFATGFSCLLGCNIDATRYAGVGTLHDEHPAPPAGGYKVPPAQARTCDGGAPTSSGTTCTTSFKNDIYGGIMSAKLFCPSCHGLGATPPTISSTDASQARASLTAHVLNGLPYVNPCATDPSQSSIMCNLQGSCGSLMPPGGGIAPEDLAKIDAWLRCGAPDN
jgi:hypothetical protein